MSFWTISEGLDVNWCMRRLTWTLWHPQNRSRIFKTLSEAIFIDFTYVVKCKSVNYLILFAFPWFRGYEKDTKHYSELICPRIWAWALSWTCLVEKTMFSEHWQVSARRRVWKSKWNLWLLATWGLQEVKGPILMFYIFICICICIMCIHASMHICIYASMHLCICASKHLCIYASMHLCI